MYSPDNIVTTYRPLHGSPPQNQKSPRREHSSKESITSKEPTTPKTPPPKPKRKHVKSASDTRNYTGDFVIIKADENANVFNSNQNQSGGDQSLGSVGVGVLHSPGNVDYVDSQSMCVAIEQEQVMDSIQDTKDEIDAKRRDGNKDTKVEGIDLSSVLYFSDKDVEECDKEVDTLSENSTPRKPIDEHSDRRGQLNIKKYMLQKNDEDSSSNEESEREVDAEEQADNLGDCIEETDENYGDVAAMEGLLKNPSQLYLHHRERLFRQDVTVVYPQAENGGPAEPIVVESPHGGYEEDVTSFCSGSRSGSDGEGDTESDEEFYQKHPPSYYNNEQEDEGGYGQPIIDNSPMDLKHQIELVKIRSHETILEEDEEVHSCRGTDTDISLEEPLSSNAESIPSERESVEDEYIEIDFLDIQQRREQMGNTIEVKPPEEFADDIQELARLDAEYVMEQSSPQSHDHFTPVNLEDLRSELRLELGSLADSDADLRDQFEYETVRTIRGPKMLFNEAFENINKKEHSLATQASGDSPQNTSHDISDISDSEYKDDSDPETPTAKLTQPDLQEIRDIIQYKLEAVLNIKSPRQRLKKKHRLKSPKKNEHEKYNNEGILKRSISEDDLDISGHNNVSLRSQSLHSFDSDADVSPIVTCREINITDNTRSGATSFETETPLLNYSELHPTKPEHSVELDVDDYEVDIQDIVSGKQGGDMAAQFQVYATKSAHLVADLQDIQKSVDTEEEPAAELESSTHFVNIAGSNVPSKMPDIIQSLSTEEPPKSGSLRKQYNIIEDIQGEEAGNQAATATVISKALQSLEESPNVDLLLKCSDIKMDQSKQKESDAMSESSSLSLKSGSVQKLLLTAQDHTPKRFEDGAAPPVFLGSDSKNLSLREKKLLLEEYHNTSIEDLETSLTEPKEPMFAKKTADEKITAFFVRLDDPTESPKKPLKSKFSPVASRKKVKRRLPERPKSAVFERDMEGMFENVGDRSASLEEDMNKQGLGQNKQGASKVKMRSGQMSMKGSRPSSGMY